MNSNRAAPSIVRAEGGAAASLAGTVDLVVKRELVSDERFIVIVPPILLAQHLADRPEHQANLLLDAQGILGKKERDAAAASLGKLGINTTAELLTVFLETGLATPETIRSSVSHDDWPKILSAPVVWKYVTDGDWYKQISDQPEQKEGPAFDVLVAMLGLLDKHGIITAMQKYEQLGREDLISKLPKDTVVAAMRAAYRKAANEGGESTLELKSLFDFATPQVLAKWVSASDLWEKVILFAAGQEGWLLEPVTDNAAVTGATRPPPDPVLNPAAEETSGTEPDPSGATDDPSPPGHTQAVVDEGDIDVPPHVAETDESRPMRSQPPPKPKGDSTPPGDKDG